MKNNAAGHNDSKGLSPGISKVYMLLLKALNHIESGR